MIAFYVERIKKGRMTLEDVPSLWREAVKAELERDDG